MAFDLNGSGGDQDVMYDSQDLSRPRPSQYAPSVLTNLLSPWRQDQKAWSFAPQDQDAGTAPDLGRTPPPAAAPITTDHMGPRSPLDEMLGRYNAAEDAYKSLLEKGPDQFKPSIWRRLAGTALGTAAGMGGQRMGYGRYSGFSANPQEAANVTRQFVFGPQGRLNDVYQRQLASARLTSEDAMKNYQLTRQEDIDDRNARNIASEMEARNRPQVVEGYRVPQEGGAATPIPIDYGGQLPEGIGQPPPGTLPEVIQAKEKAPLEAADARQQATQQAADERQNKLFKEQEKLQSDREAAADRRQQAGLEQKGKQGLQKVVDDARNIDALEQEQRTILDQVSQPEEKGGGKRGTFGGGPYLNGPQSMQFLANHMALTVGRIKGARTGKDLIEAHIKARDLDQATEALASRVLSGGVLTYQQAQQMLGTTGVKRASAWQKVRETGQDLNVDTDDYVPTEYGGKRPSATQQQTSTPQTPAPPSPPANGMKWQYNPNMPKGQQFRQVPATNAQRQ